jgi:hypothetical protein
MALELLIGAIGAREDGGAEHNPCDSGADENKSQGENLAQQDIPPVSSKRLLEVLQGRCRNPVTEITRVIFGCSLAMCQVIHGRVRSKTGGLAGEFPEEFLFVHRILERFAAVDEDNRNFVVKLSAEFDIGIHVNFAPRESSPARKLGEAFLHHFAKVAAFSGVHDDATRLLHAGGF